MRVQTRGAARLQSRLAQGRASVAKALGAPPLSDAASLGVALAALQRCGGLDARLRVSTRIDGELTGCWWWLTRRGRKTRATQVVEAEAALDALRDAGRSLGRVQVRASQVAIQVEPLRREGSEDEVSPGDLLRREHRCSERALIEGGGRAMLAQRLAGPAARTGLLKQAKAISKTLSAWAAAVESEQEDLLLDVQAFLDGLSGRAAVERILAEPGREALLQRDQRVQVLRAKGARLLRLGRHREASACWAALTEVTGRLVRQQDVARAALVRGNALVERFKSISDPEFRAAFLALRGRLGTLAEEHVLDQAAVEEAVAQAEALARAHELRVLERRAWAAVAADHVLVNEAFPNRRPHEPPLAQLAPDWATAHRYFMHTLRDTTPPVSTAAAAPSEEPLKTPAPEEQPKTPARGPEPREFPFRPTRLDREKGAPASQFTIQGEVPFGGRGSGTKRRPIAGPIQLPQALVTAYHLALTVTGARHGVESAIDPSSFHRAIRDQRVILRKLGRVERHHEMIYACRVAMRLLAEFDASLPDLPSTRSKVKECAELIALAAIQLGADYGLDPVTGATRSGRVA